MESINQFKLIGLSKNFDEITQMFNKELLPNKIMLSGKRGIGKSVLAYHLINYIFTQKEDFTYDLQNYTINKLSRSYKLIVNNTHPNFYYIGKKIEKKNIEISQIRELKDFVNKSSFNDTVKIILINDSEYLSNESGNALLKLIEEPNNNTQYILVRDRSKFILDTIKSRCINFDIFIEDKHIPYIVNNYFNLEVFNKLPLVFHNNFMTPINYINLINLCNEENIKIEQLSIDKLIKYIIENKIYKSKNYNIQNIQLYIEIYFKDKFLNYKNVNIFKLKNKFLLTLSNAIRYNLDLEPFFIEFDLLLKNEE